MPSSSDTRPPITCHVLDTTTGRPAAGIPVTLTLTSFPGRGLPPLSFCATTNADGRVLGWENGVDNEVWTTSVEGAFKAFREAAAALSGPAAETGMDWTLRFDTGRYFGEGKTFFPEVKVSFVIRPDQMEEHFHVPLLLGPYSYTTYRGS